METFFLIKKDLIFHVSHLPTGDLHESQAYLVLLFIANEKDLSAAN